jgi:hypothetical protein
MGDIEKKVTYEKRLVLFLDILGFQKIIDATEVKESFDQDKVVAIHQAIQILNEGFDNLALGKSKRVTQFSDSVVMSFDIQEYTGKKIFSGITAVLMTLIEHSWICRGAISYGFIYHDDDALFGPALNEAYNTESKAALYPRVIFDRTILDLFSDPPPNLAFLKDYQYDPRPYVNIDTDDRYYFDYFTGILGGISYRRFDGVDYYKKLRKIITDGRRYRSPDVRIKYDWMKNKYNQFVTYLPQMIVEEEIYSSDIIRLQKFLTKI